jgi:hypothetical protein
LRTAGGKEDSRESWGTIDSQMWKKFSGRDRVGPRLTNLEGKGVCLLSVGLVRPRIDPSDNARKSKKSYFRKAKNRCRMSIHLWRNGAI